MNISSKSEVCLGWYRNAVLGILVLALMEGVLVWEENFFWVGVLVECVLDV